MGCGDVITICADVSKVEDCKRFVDGTVNYYGRCKRAVAETITGGSFHSYIFTKKKSVNFARKATQSHIQLMGLYGN